MKLNIRDVGNFGVIAALLFVAASFNQPVRRLIGQTDKSKVGGRVSVLDFGAVGDGKTDDRAAIQAAIDAGDEIHFPDVPAFYRVAGSLLIGGSNQAGGKRLMGHRPCRGGGAFQGKPALVQGNGSATLMLAVGTTFQNRAVELIGLSAHNVGKPILEMNSGIDGMIDNCWFVTLKNTDATVKLRESYNVTIRESTIGCSGGGFGITAYQQCNKLRVQNCRLGGGDVGGAVHIEQSANVQLEGNVIELGVYGMVIASGIRLDRPDAGNVEGAGACHALRVASNYYENIQHPLVIGSAMNIDKHVGQVVCGAIIECNNIGTYGFDFPLMTIGRLKGASIRGNSLWRKTDGKATAIYATYAPGAALSHPTSCIIEANFLTNGHGPFIQADDVKVGNVTLTQLLATDNRIATP